MHWKLDTLVCWAADDPNEVNVVTEAGPLEHHPEWNRLPDHYPPRVEPKSPKRSLLAELGLAKPQGHPAIVGKINRRI